MPCSSICPVFITFWHCVSLQSSLLFHHAHPGLVIKWAQLKFTLQVVPTAPGVSANASFHFTARVISTQHHQDTVHDGFRILVGLRQSGLCIICHVVEMKMCAIPCLLYLARILTPSLEYSTASLPHPSIMCVKFTFSDLSAITICNLPLPAKLLLLVGSGSTCLKFPGTPAHSSLPPNHCSTSTSPLLHVLEDDGTLMWFKAH